MLPQKRDAAAALGATLRFVFGALIEVAQPAEILALGVEKEDINLMVSNADLVLLPQLTYRARRQDAQPIKINLAIEPHGQVNVFRFMETTSSPAIGFDPRCRGHRAE